MERYLIAYLDTNVVAWLSKGLTQRLTSGAKQMIDKADLLISPMVLIELEYLYELRRIKFRSRDIQLKLRAELGVTVCDLSFAIVADFAADEKWTREPFDRTIVAHAKANSLAYLISADEQIAKHYARTVW